jgi:prepilin-type N-terminal cleavage/methylation domain-containing protein
LNSQEAMMNCLITPSTSMDKLISNKHHAGQNGFTLLELLIGIVLFGVLSIGYYRDQRIETDISLTSLQAQRYQQVSTALGRFMSDNYSSIKALPHTCSTVVYAANQPKPNANFSACRLTTSATSSVVSNGMQPLLSELIDSGYLSNTFDASFVWPGLALVYQSYAGSFDPSKTDYPLAPFTYASLIQAMCNSKPVSASNTCTTPELRSLVFNSQPFAENTNFFGMRRTERLTLMRENLGAKALMSYDDAMQTEGQLYALGNKFFLDNPLVRHDNSSSAGSTFKGVAAIFALQNNFKPSEDSK